RRVEREVGKVVARVPAETEESDQRIVELVPTAAGGEGNLRCDVEARFAKCRIVAVDALLLCQPQSARKPVHRQVRIQIVDLIVLVNLVRLALVEQAGNDPERLVRW